MEQTNEYALTVLKDAKSAITSLNEINRQKEKLVIEDRRLEKLLHAEEKAVQEEISNTIKKRRSDIVSGYDKEIKGVQDNLKKVEAKKIEAKTKGIKQRIKIETQGLKAQSKQLKDDLKTLMHTNKIPSFCESFLFYALYMPCGIKEWFFAALLFICGFWGIPLGICQLLSIDSLLIVSLVFLADTLVFSALYLIGNARYKVKNYAILQQMKQMHFNMLYNKKQMKVISSSIRKDKNEDLYDLDNFNYDIAKLESEIEQITNRKKDALNTFDSVTNKVIRDEIEDNNKKRINELRAEFQANHEALTQIEERSRKQNSMVIDTYGPHIEKEFLVVDKIDALIRIVSTSNITTITEAINSYRNNRL